jgi:hypothetical protein
MDHFAGLDVSVKETSVCIVDDTGKIVREVKLLTTAACGGLRSTPDCRPRRAYLHLSYSYVSPFGPAMLVTQDPARTSVRLPEQLKFRSATMSASA